VEEFDLNRRDESTDDQFAYEIFLEAADSDDQQDINSPAYKLRQYMLTALSVGLLLLLMLAPAPASAQIVSYDPLCSPYNVDCVPTSHDFANVFVNVEGLEITNVTIANKTPFLNNVEITVLTRGSGAAVVSKRFLLNSFQGLDVFLTDTRQWPELSTYKGGVSVLIKSSQSLATTVTMHPTYDSADPKKFWREAKILEGK
jgi:hypothetical protein